MSDKDNAVNIMKEILGICEIAGEDGKECVYALIDIRRLVKKFLDENPQS